MRSAFDKLISWTGLAMAAVLIMAGGLLWWANSFIGDQVHTQLTMQGITMPEGDALAALPKADADALKPYAGSPMDTGPEAKAFADHYILAHMNAAGVELTGEPVTYTERERQGPRAGRGPGGEPEPDPGAAGRGRRLVRPASRRCWTATPCAACSSTATRSRPWAPSPASPRSSPSPERSSCCCSSASASGTPAGSRRPRRSRCKGAMPHTA